MRKINIATTLMISLAVLTTGLLPVHATGDFTISANPSSINHLIAGVGTKVTINVTSTGGFTGTVTLSASAPSGIATSFNPGSVTPPSGGSVTSQLTITPDANCNVGPGNTITVTGTSGSLNHQTRITFGVIYC